MPDALPQAARGLLAAPPVYAEWESWRNTRPPALSVQRKNDFASAAEPSFISSGHNGHRAQRLTEVRSMIRPCPHTFGRALSRWREQPATATAGAALVPGLTRRSWISSGSSEMAVKVSHSKSSAPPGRRIVAAAAPTASRKVLPSQE